MPAFTLKAYLYTLHVKILGNYNAVKYDKAV